MDFGSFQYIYIEQQQQQMKKNIEERRNYQWTNKQLDRLQKFKDRLQDYEKENLMKKIISKPSNNVEFYRILPREELPKSLQKMKFQTLHTKDKDASKAILLEKRHALQSQEIIARRQLKNMGQVLYLSQIYHKLGDNIGKNDPRVYAAPLMHSDLQIWQKQNKIGEIVEIKKHMKESRFSSRNSKRLKEEVAKLPLKDREKLLVQKFREGSDYISEIEKSLAIIAVTHASESNIVNKFCMIQNSVKILKKELDSKKTDICVQISKKMELLQETRKNYHELFVKKIQLQQQQKTICEQLAKEQMIAKITKNNSGVAKINKVQELKSQCQLLQNNNQEQILNSKRIIDSLQLQIGKLQLKSTNIACAYKTFYNLSLKSGIDCRETGLVWVLKQIRQINSSLDNLEFPSYLDKKSISFLIEKQEMERKLQQLLIEKQIFINLIGKGPQQCIKTIPQDNIKEIWTNDKAFEVPKKYRRSKKKITLLEVEYNRNQSLIECSSRKGFQISSQIQGMNGKQIYEKTQQRIKKIDLTKIKKQKTNSHIIKLQQYQALLQKIKQIHIALQDLQMQHEAYLILHYKHQKDKFMMQASACFGSKKAYSLIIKFFSLKNVFKDH